MYVGSGIKRAGLVRVYVWAGIGAEDNEIEVAQMIVIVKV